MIIARPSGNPAEHVLRILAMILGGLGVLFVLLAPTVPWWAALLGLGAVQIGASANLLWRHLRAHLDSSTPHRTALKKMRAEIVVLLLLVPYCGVIAWIGAMNLCVQTQAIQGRPVEVRRDMRAVYMPEGKVYLYRCWENRRGIGGGCPAEARWAALPRWPEPAHVEMLVAGRQIRGLKMDGEVIVEPSEFKTGDFLDRLLLLSVGVGGAVLAVHAIHRRAKALRA